MPIDYRAALAQSARKGRGASEIQPSSASPTSTASPRAADVAVSAQTAAARWSRWVSAVRRAGDGGRVGAVEGGDQPGEHARRRRSAPSRPGSCGGAGSGPRRPRRGACAGTRWESLDHPRAPGCVCAIARASRVASACRRWPIGAAVEPGWQWRWNGARSSRRSQARPIRGQRQIGPHGAVQAHCGRARRPRAAARSAVRACPRGRGGAQGIEGGRGRSRRGRCCGGTRRSRRRYRGRPRRARSGTTPAGTTE